MADIQVGQNRGGLQTIKDSVNGTAAAVGQVRSASGRMTKSGDASLVTFTQTIALSAAPSRVKLFPRTAEASKAHFVPVAGNTATQFSVTFVAAPAAASNNIVFDYEVYV